MRYLKIEDDFVENCCCIGFTSQEKDYHVAWQLDKLLNISLQKEEDLSHSKSKGEAFVQYSNYIYRNPEHESKIRLLTNKKDNFRLIPEFGMMDYVLVIDDELGIYDVSQIIKNLREVEGISFAQEIKLESIKNKDITSF